MLIRDALADERHAAGIEVFMLQRTLSASFASGMYVFPGGKVDGGDHADELEAISGGLDDRTASELLGLDRGGLAWWVAAIRECFEEAGVLLARPVDSPDPIRFDDPAVHERYDAERAAVYSGERSLVDLCRDEGLVLLCDAIHFVSHWITPVGEARRFDTRFFLARTPQAQVPLHDDGETIASRWVRPRVALDMFAAGDLQMLPPTIDNLRFLSEHPSADGAVAAAHAMGIPPVVLPKVVLSDGKFFGIVREGHPDYDDTPDPEYVLTRR
jgi:8-oxo-dGTP pyrophosphatase MutT (NUDIX family)